MIRIFVSCISWVIEPITIFYTIGRINNFSGRPTNHCQWFVCSATGWMALPKMEFNNLPELYRRQYSTIEKNGLTTNRGKLFPRWYLDEDDIPTIWDAKRLKPYGIAEPLKWLFTEVAKKK